MHPQLVANLGYTLFLLLECCPISSSESVLLLVSVEDNVFRIAVAGKHLADVLLLFGRQSALAVLVTVVHAVVAEVGGKLLAHPGVVLAQHIFIDVLEAVGIFHYLLLLEILAFLAAAGRRQHGRAYVHPIRDVLADGIIYALFSLRAFGIEAKQAARANLLKIKLVFHDIAKIIYFAAECKIYSGFFALLVYFRDTNCNGSVVFTSHKLIGNIKVAV